MECIIHTDELLLRPFTEQDIEPFYHAASESVSAVYPWLEWCHPAYSISDSTSWVKLSAQMWDRDEEFNFGIFERHSGILVGGCAINNIHKTYRLGNLGYWIRSSAQGNSFAAKASVALARHFLLERLFNRLEIVCAVDNHASNATARSTGATSEGKLRNRLLVHGVLHDAFLYSFIPSDFSS
jgi:RimJ/RimL family protein N-acetyltransferase